MGTPKAGRWIVAAALLAASATCLVLLLAAAASAPSPDEPTAAGVPSRDDPRTAARRPASGPGATVDATTPTVEIDDAPIPDGATLTVRGFVRDRAGAPVADTHVYAERRAGTFSGPIQDGGRAKSGSDGGYVIEGLDPAATWSVSVYADGFAPSGAADAVIATASRLERRCDFVLVRLGVLDVVVCDERGAPVAHRTWIRSMSPDRRDHDVRPSGLEPGRYRVFVSATDLAGETRDVDVADGATTRVEFRLGPAVAISGVLLAADGDPMAGFDVVAVPSDETSPHSVHRAKTGRDGSFTIRGLRRARYDVHPDDGVERLDFSADGGERVEAPADAVRLQVREAATVRFHLVYPSGFSTSQRSAEVGVAVTVRSLDQRVAAKWDYDRGEVRVPGGEDVELVLDVPECLQFRRRVNARAGDSFDLGDVALVAEREIVGRVVDVEGRGVWGANVAGRLDDGARIGGGWGVDRNGWFRLVRLPPGEITVEFAAGGFAATTVRWESGRDKPLIVTLRRGGRLFVRAQSAAGAPLAGAAVRIVATDGVAPTGTVLDAFGELAQRVAAGRWRVEVAGCAPVDVEIREGATTSVTVRAASQ